MNTENLRPVKTKEEARQRGHNGGIKSGEAKRKKRLIRETLEIILDMPVKDADTLAHMKNLGLSDPVTYRDYVTASILTKTAETGSMSDLEKLAGILGEDQNSDPAILSEARLILAQIPSVID